MILSSWFAPNTAGSEVTSWSYSIVNSTLQGSGTGREEITYAVSAHISSITKGNETVFIDYEQFRLYRYSKMDNSCKSFHLNNPSKAVRKSTDPKETAFEKMINMLGSFKVIATDNSRIINNYTCQEKHILSGNSGQIGLPAT